MGAGPTALLDLLDWIALSRQPTLWRSLLQNLRGSDTGDTPTADQTLEQEEILRELRKSACREEADRVRGQLGGQDWLLTWADASYPAALRQIADPPCLLYAAGKSEILRLPAVAIVGARDSTGYGTAMACELSRDLARAGMAVVSGFAVGIDGAAHRAALEANGPTVAVLGAGSDVAYPRQHGRLRAQLKAGGLILTEYGPGTEPRAHHFPRRNRIISGLSLGVIVIEASLRSGSLWTARHALEQGREVFAVPGQVGHPRSRGPHSLLRQGAVLVESAADVLSELEPLLPKGPTPTRYGPDRGAVASRDPVEPTLALADPDPLLAALSGGASSVDQLARACGLGVPQVWARVLELELAGRLIRGPAGRLQILRVPGATSPMNR